MIDPTQNHDACMKALDSAGIYVLSDLADSKSSESIDRNPLNSKWDTTLYTRYTSVVDALQKYTNVIGFTVGNEVVQNVSSIQAAAYVKAAGRDIKAYIKSKNYRSSLAIGYQHMDIDTSKQPVDINTNMAAYFNCGGDRNALDFWGLNIYSWCGQSNMSDSHYDTHLQEFASYSSPVFFSEYGCTLPQKGIYAADRPWTEVDALYGPKMSSVFSGGIAFEYFEEGDKTDPTKDYGSFPSSTFSVKTILLIRIRSCYSSGNLSQHTCRFQCSVYSTQCGSSNRYQRSSIHTHQHRQGSLPNCWHQLDYCRHGTSTDPGPKLLRLRSQHFPMCCKEHPHPGRGQWQLEMDLWGGP
jgi:Glucanosyltransferase